MICGIKEETRERKNAVLFLEKRNERGKKSKFRYAKKGALYESEFKQGDALKTLKTLPT